MGILTFPLARDGMTPPEPPGTAPPDNDKGNEPPWEVPDDDTGAEQ